MNAFLRLYTGNNASAAEGLFVSDRLLKKQEVSHRD
jgi:hypothetical protein